MRAAQRLRPCDCRGVITSRQLAILARAFLGGLVELHGREHAAHILNQLAEGLVAGLPLPQDCSCRSKDGSTIEAAKITADLQAGPP